jgi:hypothetical protein
MDHSKRMLQITRQPRQRQSESGRITRDRIDRMTVGCFQIVTHGSAILSILVSLFPIPRIRLMRSAFMLSDAQTILLSFGRIKTGGLIAALMYSLQMNGIRFICQSKENGLKWCRPTHAMP